MGKGDRRHKLPKGIPPLAPIKPRGKQARENGRFVKPPEDAPRVALTARCHHYGLTATTDNREAVKGQHMGSAIGMVMRHECTATEIAALWTVWQGFCAAERTYRLRIIGQSGTAKGASIGMVPDKLEADTGHTIDSRTDTERDNDAVRAWTRWRGYLWQLPPQHRAALHAAELATPDDLPLIWRDHAPTRHGLFTLDAIKRLSHVVGD